MRSTFREISSLHVERVKLDTVGNHFKSRKGSYVQVDYEQAEDNRKREADGEVSSRSWCQNYLIKRLS